MKTQTIVQLSDIHIGAEGELLHGVNARERFLEVLNEVQRLQPDAMVVSGDICASTPDISVYHWVEQQFGMLNFPVFCLPGNHDSAELMRRILHPEQVLERFPEVCLVSQNQGRCGDIPWYAYRIALGALQIVLGDTASCELAMEQFHWLHRELQERPSVLFVHHPLSFCGCCFMDARYPLRNHEEITLHLRENPCNVSVFCGHYHTERTLKVGDTTIFVTPSTALQVDAFSEELKFCRESYGFRVIRWHEERCETWVKWLHSSRDSSS